MFVPDYRLAPERLRPAPLNDARAVLDALPEGAAVVGDGAGGHLALRLALAAPSRRARLGLVSPNTDRTGLSRTRGSLRDAMTDDAGDARRADMAFGDAGPAARSPLQADLRGLPPVWLTASTDEVLLDDSLLLARALGLAGVPATLEVVAGMMHLWPLWPDALPEGARTSHALAAFLAA